MSEKEFQRAVVDLARMYGWLCYHTYDSRRSEPGFPDLTLARGGRLLLAELKTEKGRLSAAQKAWASELPACQYRLWRPSDLDAIVAELSQTC